MKSVVIMGGGGHAKVVFECVGAQGIPVVGFFDANPAAKLFDVKYMGDYSADVELFSSLVLAIGNNETRSKIADFVKHEYAFVVHPSAIISPSASVGNGCMVFHRGIIQASCRIGNHVILNTGAQIDHDCALGDFVHVGPGAVLCGDVSIGEGCLIGAGAVVMPGVKVGKWAQVGAGAVVHRNVEDGAIVKGVPAK